ncbi:MAG: hypothetical protein NTY09_00930 [bacterium]|nr:hypothetical protein [bacterium]
MFFSSRIFLLLAITGVLLYGCAGHGSQPVAPDETPSIPELTGSADTASNSSGNSHYLLSYNFIYVDPEAPDGPKFEIVPVREGEIHLNILKFLEDGPCTNCFKIVGFNVPQPGYLDVDIQIDHPFDYLFYSVFDVRGIMMFQGSHEFPVAGKSISDPTLGDGALLNADGYTALYNGSTITAPVGDLQKYYPGNMATPAIPNSDINGYKYFITDIPANNRNAFFGDSSGVDVQTYSLKLPTGPFVMGYAVDANWWTPINSPVNDPLTDFDLNANCPEPWKIGVTEVQIGGGLTDQGGQTKLWIDVFDWQGKDTHHNPVVECPELFDGTIAAIWNSDKPTYSIYEVILPNSKLASAGEYPCLVSIEANENDPVGKPWLDLKAYQTYIVKVAEGQTGDGNLLWAKRAGGTYFENGYGITSLSDNSAVVIGWFTGSATFGPSEPNQTVLTSVGSCNTFIARYNPDGTLAWAKRAGRGNNYEEGLGITTLSDNSTVVTGGFNGSATFGSGEPNETVLTSDGGEDIFIARYNPDGTGGEFYGLGDDWGNGITTLSDNSTVVTGVFEYSATFGPGEPNQTVLSSVGSRDIFIARYNQDGTLAWAKRAGGISYNDGGYGITTLSDNSTVVTGEFNGSATFGPGEPNQTILTSASGNDIFVARYNPEGTLAWAKRAGGGSSENGCGITALSDNSTVVTGWLGESATFGPGEPNEIVLNGGFFIARYNANGSLAWAKSVAGARGEGITALSDNSTVVTGEFCGSVTFGPGEPIQTNLTSDGYSDIFIAHYNPDGTLAWVKRAGGASTSDDRGFGITALSDNSTVGTGQFFKSSTFGPGEPNETILTSDGYEDIFIARFNP